jgi:alkylation response protein AidB-like acyl-CoA dehydrogenase
MDFSLPPRVVELKSQVRAFVEREVIPLEAGLHRGFSAVEPALRALREKVRALGMLTPQLPKEEGGSGFTLLEYACLAEELGRSPLGAYSFNCQAPDTGNMELIHRFGSDEQKQRWLRPLVRGEIRSCFAMTEPERPGSNPIWMETRAVKDGGSWVIDGHKWFASSCDGSAFAVVMAVTDPSAHQHQQASMILVPTGTPGYQLVRNIPVMGHAGEGWESHAEVRFTNCRVPLANLLGGEGMGFALAQERLGPGRIQHCMRWIGICERSFEMMCQRAALRELSPGKPLGTRQAVQTWIAESRGEIDAARLLVLHAAWKMEREGQQAARDQISTIKWFVAGVMNRVVDRALQTHGALGMTDDTILAAFYRFERAARIYDGPDEVHKMVIARHLLKGYGVEVK